MIWHVHNYSFLTFISIMTRPRKIRHRDRAIETNDIDFNLYSYAVQVKSKHDQDGNPIFNKNGKKRLSSTLRRLSFRPDRVISIIGYKKRYV